MVALKNATIWEKGVREREKTDERERERTEVGEGREGSRARKRKAEQTRRRKRDGWMEGAWLGPTEAAGWVGGVTDEEKREGRGTLNHTDIPTAKSVTKGSQVKAGEGEGMNA